MIDRLVSQQTKLKVYFTHQSGTKPPRFDIEVNSKGLVHFSYYRYLENKIRENIDFSGTPIIIQFKNKGEKELQKYNSFYF